MHYDAPDVLTALVLAHEGGPAAIAGVHVAIDCVGCEAGLAADEPSEVAPAVVRVLRVPLEHALPAPMPGKRLGGLGPEPVRVRFGGADECAYLGVDCLHLRVSI